MTSRRLTSIQLAFAALTIVPALAEAVPAKPNGRLAARSTATPNTKPGAKKKP